MRSLRRLHRSTTSRRARRGAEIVEFALIFPIYLVLFFGIIEYSWYFYQRGVVIEAARSGCRSASLGDPDDEATAAANGADAIDAVLSSGAGIDCDGLHTCTPSFVFQNTATLTPGAAPRRVICQVTVNFISLTGFLGATADPSAPVGGAAGQFAADSWGATSITRFLPEQLTGRSVAIFQEDD